MQRDFWEAGRSRTGAADVPKNEQGARASAHKSGSPSTTEKEHNSTADAQWKAIPAAERFELLATIREVREWRFGDEPPLRLAPIRQVAFELHQWLNRHPDVR